jgi:predicted MFS family arabinose efflux permease
MRFRRVRALAWMPNVPTTAPESPGFRWRRLWYVVNNRDYRRLITFSCWFGFFNGLTQAAQFIYPSRVLEFEYFEWLALRSGLRAGQTIISPALGRCVDRLGNIPVMLACQALVASGPLFFLLATPSARWWIAVAYVVWIAYAGLNIGLPNLMLGLSPRKNDARYIAVYFAASELSYGTGTVCGGLLLDRLRRHGVTFSIESMVFDAFRIVFLIGLATRAVGVLLVARIREPADLV